VPIFETLALLSILFGVIACLSWNELKEWIRSNSPIAAADLVRTALANGDVQIVAIGLNAKGAQTASKKWRAKLLDSELANRFGHQNSIRVTV